MDYYSKLFEQINLGCQAPGSGSSTSGCVQAPDSEAVKCKMDELKDRQDLDEPRKFVPFSQYARLAGDNICDSHSQIDDILKESLKSLKLVLHSHNSKRQSKKVRRRRKKKKALSTKFSKLKL